MKKLHLILLIAFFCISIAGCAALQKAASEVTPEQQTQMTNQIATTAGPFIPQPYQIPATLIAGYLACIGYNWFKDKTKPKV